MRSNNTYSSSSTDKYKSQRKPQEFDWFYRKPAWQRIRQMALSRDNGICQRCYKKNIIKKADVVHHIIYLIDDFQKALDLNNLESLCHACHNAEHDEKATGIKSKWKKNIRRGLTFDDEGNIIEE